MQRSITKRAVGLVGLGSLTAAVTLMGAGAAQADGQKDCGQVHIEHSEDGGQSWSTSGRLNGSAPTKITVRLTDTVGDGCSYQVSLASYSAEGASWQTSGTQAFLGWATAELNKDTTQATLDVSAHAPTCFGQIDLYGNGIQYDGGSGESHGALPHYPESATPVQLITAWNGGEKCTTTPTPTPTVTTPSGTPSTTDSPSGTPSPTDSASGTPSPSTSVPTEETPSGSPSPTTSAPVVADTTSPSPSGTGSAQPVGSPVVAPDTSKSTGGLAETGGNGSQNLAFAGGGAALLVIGAGAVYFTRRRNASHR